MQNPLLSLQLLDALTAPGNPPKPNDDAWCATPRLAAVIDGATGLGGRLLPGESDAAWLAHRAAARLAVHAGHGDARAALAATTADLEADFRRERARAPAETYEIPFASLMMVEPLAGQGLRALWFGDCCAILQRPGGPVQVIGDAFDRRGGEAAGAARLAASSGSGPAAAEARTAFLPALRAQRNRCNQPGGPWVLAPDSRCAEMAQSAEIQAPEGTIVLLASDGFLALSSDYARYDPAGLLAAAQAAGLAALLDELRAIERGDPEGRLYPRYKTSDDASAVLLRVGQISA